MSSFGRVPAKRETSSHSRLLALCALALLASAAPWHDSYASSPVATWEQSPPAIQLLKDRTLMPMGKGLVFVPAMTDPLGEPFYSITQDEEFVGESMTGRCSPLPPGIYEVRLGSGNIEQMITRLVEVKEGHTTVLLPNWSGLVIDVVDETRTSVKESYELFDQNTQENYGLGKGIDEELGEELTTWILEPGLYKIVKPGQNIYAAVNFATVRLLPGELVRYALVVDTETDNFIGFGQVTQRATQLAALRNWTLQSEISGNVTANTLLKHLLKRASKSIDVGDEEDSYTVSAQWRNDLRYSSGRQYAIIRLIVEEGLTREADQPLQNQIDSIDLRATYIFRFSERFGPYLRFASASKAFAERKRFKEPQDVVKLDTAGDTVKVYDHASEVTLSPPFFPLELKEGVGARVVLYKSFFLNFDFRAGYGARQYYVRDSYDLADSLMTPKKESRSRGMEMLLGVDALISRYVTLTSEFDMLMPTRQSDSWEYDLSNQFRIHISRYVSFDVIAKLSKKPNIEDLQYEEQVLVRFSFLL